MSGLGCDLFQTCMFIICLQCQVINNSTYCNNIVVLRLCGAWSWIQVCGLEVCPSWDWVLQFRGSGRNRWLRGESELLDPAVSLCAQSVSASKCVLWLGTTAGATKASGSLAPVAGPAVLVIGDQWTRAGKWIQGLESQGRVRRLVESGVANNSIGINCKAGHTQFVYSKLKTLNEDIPLI